MRLANRRPAPHERVENRQASKVMLPVERFDKVFAVRQRRAEQDASEDRTQAFRPPFVDVVNGPMDFLAPTLHLRELRNELKWKRVRFDEPTCARMSVGLKVIIHLPPQLPRLPQ